MDTKHVQQAVAAIAAESNQEKKKREDTVQLVVFTLDQEEYAAPIADVQEIIRMTEVTPVPGAPEYIRGILNVHGKIVVVVDLEKRFHLTHTGEAFSRHIIITEVAENTFGVIVDQAVEILRVPVSSIQPTPAVVSSKIHLDYVSGVIVIEEERSMKTGECTQEGVDTRKKAKTKKSQATEAADRPSRLIVLIDLPKILQEKELLLIGDTVTEAAGTIASKIGA